MAGPRMAVAVLLMTLVGSPVGSAADEAEDAKALADLKVIVVSPQAGKGHASGIGKLLEANGATVELVAWKAAGHEKVGGYDLIVVTGPGRGVGRDVVRDYTVPVLGLGPYGHKYFGLEKLKHGYPYS